MSDGKSRNVRSEKRLTEAVRNDCVRCSRRSDASERERFPTGMPAMEIPGKMLPRRKTPIAVKRKKKTNNGNAKRPITRIRSVFRKGDQNCLVVISLK